MCHSAAKKPSSTCHLSMSAHNRIFAYLQINARDAKFNSKRRCSLYLAVIHNILFICILNIMSTILSVDFYAEICHLTREETKNWRQVLKYGDGLELNSKRKLLWTWPTEKNLKDFKCLLEKFNIKHILSIGCGNGLLEWLLTESLDISVYGLEIDRNWWQSQYAIKSFIKLNYAEDILKVPTQLEETQQFLQNCCNLRNWNFALLFSYFNNQTAFLHYISLYKGNWIIIIGPSENVNIHTEPMPLHPNFGEESSKEWQLKASLPIDKCDILALYERLSK